MIHQTIRDYRILSKLGEGGMGEVWLAEHAHLGNRVAIKVLTKYLRNHAGFSERFLLEARSQAKLSHPNIIQVKDFFIENGQYFMVTEFCPGINLHQMLTTRGMMSVDDALNMFKPLLSALNHAHSQGVIHRDIKPANLMVTPDMTAKVMDFGLAAVAGTSLEGTDRLVIGSPHYMSPEQIRNPQTPDHRIDLYAMGIVLYEMLTGTVPFDGATTNEIWEKHLNEMPMGPRVHNARVDKTLNQIILKAIEKDPEHRFAGCGEFLEFLEYREQEQARQAMPEPKPPRKPSPSDLNYGRRTAPKPLQKPVADNRRPTGPLPVAGGRIPGHGPSKIPTAPPPRGLSTPPKQSALAQPPTTPLPQRSAPPPQRQGFIEPETKAPKGPDPVTQLFGEAPTPLFVLLAALLSLAGPFILGVITPNPELGVPMLPEDILSVFYGGVNSTIHLHVSMVLFASIFGGLYIWRDIAREGFDHNSFWYALLAVPLGSVVCWYVLLQWALPGLVYVLIQVGALSLITDPEGGYSGSAFSQGICLLIWFGYLALTLLIARLLGSLANGR